MSLASTFLGLNVRVNSIAPGLFPSEITGGKNDKAGKNKVAEAFLDGIPAGRAGKEDDMAATVLYLAGRGETYLNGNVIYLEGGTLLTTPSVA